ncbi:uncharacterized protein LOC110387525 [Numida meleagris]|uniref:uncharacterized protein LOC110387525 n=1 Tax=Numida meleagris TaxID=8996 RepID=UPI000B3D99F1|nr:uncharacterized protein LOC110387525 [Numida meleagris]
MGFTCSSCAATNAAASCRQQSLGWKHRGTPNPHRPRLLNGGATQNHTPLGPIQALGGLCLLAAASSLPTQPCYLSRAVRGVDGCRMEGWGWLLVLGAAVLLGAESKAPLERPTFGDIYHVKGAISLPYAEIREPFEAWYNLTGGKSRIEYYGGQVVTFQFGSVGPFGASFKVTPETTETEVNVRKCFRINGTDRDPIAPQSVFPSLEHFRWVREERFRGQHCAVWQNVSYWGHKKNVYTLRVGSSARGPVPLHYEVRGYNSLLGSHYDKYEIEYSAFGHRFAPSVFQLPHGERPLPPQGPAGGFGNYACDGGEEWRAYEWIKKHGGIASTESYGPYLGQNGYCHYNQSELVAPLVGYVTVEPGSAEALKAALFKHGPVAVNIDASHKSFAFYANGVYEEPRCGNETSDLDHAVLAVGYGVLHGKSYWLIKNSWSTYWGNDGYILIAMKDNNCGVATAASFPILA